MMRHEISEILVFVIAARLGSLAAAADYLEMSAADVDAIIKYAEAELEVRLLNRDRDSVSATDAGRRIIESWCHREDAPSK